MIKCNNCSSSAAISVDYHGNPQLETTKQLMMAAISLPYLGKMLDTTGNMSVMKIEGKHGN